MIAVLDFGSTLNKALIYDEGQFSFYKFSLSYVPQVFSSRNITESFHKLEHLSGKKLLAEKERPLGQFYLTSGLPLPSEISNLTLLKSVVATSRALEVWENPVLEVGSQFIYFGPRLGVGIFETENLLKWLPFKITLSEVQNYIDNQRIYSNLLPIFPRDLYLEKAIAREKITALLADDLKNNSANSLILSGGIFCACPLVSQAIHVFLDCFGTITNPLEVQLDQKNALPCLSTLKLYEPEVFEKVPAEFGPFSLGSVFHFPGEAEVAIDLGLKEALQVKVPSESLFVFPLKEGEEAQLTLTSATKSQEPFKVFGGRLGLVVDTRSRPLSLPADSAKRMTLLKSWEEQLGATGHNTSL